MLITSPTVLCALHRAALGQPVGMNLQPNQPLALMQQSLAAIKIKAFCGLEALCWVAGATQPTQLVQAVVLLTRAGAGLGAGLYPGRVAAQPG